MKSYFNSFNILSKNDLDELERYLEPITLNKHDLLFPVGTICNQLTIVKSGILRSFCLCYEGNEQTNVIYFPGEIVTAYSSLLSQTPSEESIEALEKTNLISISRNNLFNSNLNWQRVGRIIAENQYTRLENHVFSLLKLSSKERYDKLLKEYPQYIQNVPLKYLASYLGITPRHLSRLRKNINL